MGRVQTDPAVTYRVYSADEIPRAARPRPSAPPSPWPPVRRAALDLASASKRWALAPKPRPPARQALREPVLALVEALRPALATVDWKRLGIGLAVGIGTALTLLFTVLFLAEVADGSARPRGARNATTATSEATAEPVVEPDVAAPEGEGEAASIAADPAPAPAKPAARARPKTKRKPVEVFIP